jgi:putative Mg2+ transporter-C (MgtC) family protein
MNALPDPADWMQVLLRLLAATAVGGALGLNRELSDKPAGLRTHALVALGSALMAIVAVQLASEDGRLQVDAASRVVQGVIAGVGFIGGGVILHKDGRNVQGITTAATIWLAAALGVACGLGLWQTAVMTVIVVLLVLVVGRFAESALHRHHRSHEEGSGEG